MYICISVDTIEKATVEYDSAVLTPAAIAEVCLLRYIYNTNGYVLSKCYILMLIYILICFLRYILSMSTYLM